MSSVAQRFDRCTLGPSAKKPDRLDLECFENLMQLANLVDAQGGDFDPIAGANLYQSALLELKQCLSHGRATHPETFGKRLDENRLASNQLRIEDHRPNSAGDFGG